jgi:hypothetical protein
MSDRTSFDEKHINEKVIDSPPSEIDHGIVKDWDEEESAVRRKFVSTSILAHWTSRKISNGHEN